MQLFLKSQLTNPCNFNWQHLAFTLSWGQQRNRFASPMLYALACATLLTLPSSRPWSGLSQLLAASRGQEPGMCAWDSALTCASEHVQTVTGRHSQL